ncbi:MAG: exo-alpha-sialidase, partial [Planctomycetota bacterium]
KVHRSDDGGQTYTEIAAPQYPPQPEGQVDLCPMRKTPIPWKTELVWALVPGGKDEPGVLWCGTIPGGLFKTTDRGATWELVRSLWDEPKRKAWFGGGMDYPGIHSICVDPRDSKRVMVGVSCGGAWLTTDGGKSWACRADGMWAAYMPPEQKGTPEIQDPHCLVQCPVQPDHLWVQHHNGVFRSTDGAKSWHEVTTIEPSTFGFAVAVHPHNANTAWFVPAISDERRIPVDGKVVVARTRDGGKTCEVIRAGLPQENSYDLTFRHGLDVDDTGKVLAFGSTTGSLWVSEDGGDHWQGLSHHLPPIHCVRFG